MLAPRPELVNPSLAWLGAMDGPEFNRWFRGSPLERTRRRRVHRNVAIAMGNSGDSAFREQLKTWADDPDLVLAEAAAWALQRLDDHAACGLKGGSVPPRTIAGFEKARLTAWRKLGAALTIQPGRR